MIWSLFGGTVVAFLLVAAFLNSENGREILFCPFLNESLERVEVVRGRRDALKVLFSDVETVVPKEWVQIESGGLPLILPSGRWEFHGDSPYLRSNRDDRVLLMPIKEVGEFLSYVRKFPGVRDIQDEFELMDNMFTRDLSERCRLLNSGSEIFIRFALIEPKFVLASQGFKWIRKAPDVIWWYQETRGPQNFGWIHILMRKSKMHLIVMTRRPEVIQAAGSLVFAKTVGFKQVGFSERDLQTRFWNSYPAKQE